MTKHRYPANDPVYEDVRIDGVEAAKDGYSVHMSSGWSFFIAKEYDGETHGIVPTVGDSVRTYGEFGRPVRGLFINGRKVYYRTEEEQDAENRRLVEASQRKRRVEFEEKRAELDAKYEALPPIFKERIDRFRNNNPDFRWEFEGYEMFCCEEAVKLAKHLGTVEAMERYCALAASETFRKNRALWDIEWEQQKAIDRAAGLSNDHSGNTHGAAVMLALLYLRQPNDVARMHGALAPLVGSKAYGDVPKDET